LHLFWSKAVDDQLGANRDLETVGEAAERKRWEFLLVAAPIAVTGGTGSPINPIATF
jgi:hypothetical protein